MEKLPVLSLQTFENESEAFLYANTFEDHLERHHTHILSPHKHDFFVVILFTAGSGWHEIDFIRYDIAPGTLFFMRPAQMHHWKFDTPPKGYIILHSLSFYRLTNTIQPIFEFPFYRRVGQKAFLKPENTDTTEQLMREILAEYKSSLSYKTARCGSLVNLFYIAAARSFNDDPEIQNPGERSAGLFREFNELIESDFQSVRSPAAYASRLHISVKHLTRISLENSGFTAGQLIAARILLEARRKLGTSSHQLAEIALTLGFEEYSYFSRWFKRQTGISPAAFRKKYQDRL